MRFAVAFALFSVLGCADEGIGETTAPVIYGPTDDRVEVFEHPSALYRTIASSAIAVQVDALDLDRTDPSNVRITYTATLGEDYVLCPDTAFQDQIDPGYCSGTLIDDRHILTAGHCVAEAPDCDGSSFPWVFGFYYEAAGRFRTLRADDVYDCAEIVVFRNDDVEDYAVIELDRPVVGHVPAFVRADPEPAPIGTALTMIGHPNGIPMKITDGATIIDTLGVELHAHIDAFSGNSGSAVFDDGGEIIGVLVAGSPDDYLPRAGEGCDEVVLLPTDTEEYEIITEVGTPMDAFCAAPGVSSPACDPTIPRDAGTVADGGVLPGDDAGTVGEPRRGGCGCRVASSRMRSPAVALALVGVAFLAMRVGRRRRESSGRA